MQHPKRCRNASIYIPQFSDWILHDLTIFDQFHPNSLHLNLGVAGGTGGLEIAQHQAAPFVAPSRSPGPSTRLRAHDQLRRLSGAWPGTGPKKLRLVGMLIHAEICTITIYLLNIIYIYRYYVYITIYIYLFYIHTYHTHTIFVRYTNVCRCL